MRMIDYNLPEWVFLDGNSHQGDTLKNRTIIQHIRSYTILEVIAIDDFFKMNLKKISYEFEFKNSFGLTEKFKFALHFSLAEDYELSDIFKKAEKWYCNYLKWEDNNIFTDEKTKLQSRSTPHNY
jgi:hypothetical protein